ncbi:MAG: hypothetical protein HQK98_06620 [Nitrospirae bacterium]|nr:hypothetical protein [Nitrospirota bacterium]
MKNYIITIGGTGARCLESLVHLSAGGVFEKDVSVLHIDADKDNGNWLRAFTVINQYKRIKHLIRTNETEFFRRKVAEDVDDIRFYPLPEKGTNTYYTSLDEYVGDSELTKILFTPEIRRDKWDVGFKGRSSLGATATAGAFNWDKAPWHKLHSDVAASLANSEEVRVFLIGSVFGGTGSSIFPTIGKFFGDEFGKYSGFSLGGAILFPYFKYTVPEGKKADYADPSQFLVKTKLHMQYYVSLGAQNPFKKIFMLGEKEYKKVPAGVGAKDQENPPHELLSIGV